VEIRKPSAPSEIKAHSPVVQSAPICAQFRHVITATNFC
jgi:hypothetical protein